MAHASLSLRMVTSVALLSMLYFVAESKPAALFVFGDSYADTGNHDPASDADLYRPWRKPYGETWPGRPSGRYSDGRLLTDYFASFLGIRTPVTYRVLRTSSPERITTGVNFAFGGSGVFPTFGPQFPNISSQIAQFRETIQRGLFSKELLASSFVLLVVAGNDYTAYTLRHPDNEGVTKFIPKVVKQIAACVQVLYELGLRRFAVTNLEPFGCFPRVATGSNYTKCGAVENGMSELHNKFLAAQIDRMRKQLKGAEFMELDLDGAFKAVLGAEQQGKVTFSLGPCCKSISNSTSCGEEDLHGLPLYSLCSSPSQIFFWDSVHPTQAAWKAVSKALFSSSPG